MTEWLPDVDPERACLYARRIVHDRTAGRWTIHVDPAACRASLDVSGPHPSVEALRAGTPTRTERDGTTAYEGRLLFSAGVVPIVDGRVPLLFRDADAPTDPLRWTAPAGRAAGTPESTALREFYEELVVYRDGRPAYVDVDGRPDMRETYRAAVRAAGGDPDAPLATIPARVPASVRAAFDTVEVRAGDRGAATTCFAHWHAEASTLELLTAVELDADPDRLSFADGECDRCVELFPTDALAAMPRDALVPALAAFVAATF